MRFEAIDEGSAVFIDANVFVYHFAGASAECTALLGRCEKGELRGCTSVLAVAEVCHRLMVIEAVGKRLVSASNVARKLAKRPDVVRQLTTYEASVEAIPAMGIEVLAISETTISQALRFQRRYGFVTSDSILVATMIQHGVRFLASADRRLAVANEVEVVVPGDLNPAVKEEDS